jgi:hypothetical protein
VKDYLEDVPEVGRPSTSSRPSSSSRPSTARDSVIDPNAPKLPTSQNPQISNLIKYYKDEVSKANKLFEKNKPTNYKAAQENDIIKLYRLIM